MNLFDLASQEKQKKSAPLAVRMRPKSLEEYIGQKHIVGPGKLLRRAILADQLSSLIFYGPPGTGKTALAQVIAENTKGDFIRLNAVTAGASDLKNIIQTAKDNLTLYAKKTIVFIDEIHRFNKAQQDILLPYVEDGTIVLIGATTENPYFEVNSALLSRSKIFKLFPLEPDEIKAIISTALKDKERGLGNLPVKITADAMEHFVHTSGGDARKALNAIELAVLTSVPNKEGIIEIDLEVAEESIQEKAILYDKNGDQHYDVVSAFIKSMRGSDPNASLHWLARMLAAGEDPRFIARRMIILAAEDIGLADPQALAIAINAAQALDYIGLPEARIPLAEACIYLACAPKSNSVYVAIDKALNDVKKNIGSVPLHLKDGHYPGAKSLNYGAKYLYPHDYPGNHVKQEYLPDKLAGIEYYYPSDNGKEQKIKSYLLEIKEKNNEK
ncbi:replication-associated recombination protein A [Bacillota bacterium LX-D]|nr:replication-associated recombination protein A [Bacillota bacterium LX-D]